MDRVPNLFVPGFQKCGTTSLFAALSRHPEIDRPVRWDDLPQVLFPKEINFFNNLFERGSGFYSSLYDFRGPYAIDGTPNYLPHSTAMKRLSEMVSHPKFVVSLRDPVERVASAWNHWHQLEEGERWLIPLPEGTFRENIEAELAHLQDGQGGGGFFGIGCYAYHLESVFRMFEGSCFHFTFCEWLASDFEAEMRRIYEFLELEPQELGRIHIHQREKSFVVEEEDREWLRELYRESSLALETLLPCELPWSWHH